jgi:2-dehydropantoate 2-reductase|tara:strand:- start:460 stop:1392 length:933 start_codon:yes stop_codon:yes gene_type:complete
MKILILGSGGLGGYFGGRLAAAGFNVTFVARGRHFQSIAKGGLKVRSPLGNAKITNLSVVESPRKAGVFDIIVNCVKMWDLESASCDLKHNLGKKTIIIPLQNGIDSEKILCKTLGKHHVVGGVAHISAKIVKPGVIKHNGRLARLIFGVIKGNQSKSVIAKIKRFRLLCLKSGIDCHISRDISLDIWGKFIFLVAFSGVTALTKKSIGSIRGNKKLKEFFYLTMQETFNVAKKLGVRFKKDPLEKWESIIESMPSNYRASMYEDLKIGKKLELPWLSLRVVQLGKKFRINTPKNLEIVKGLRPYINGRN